jgi:Choline/ethanolamine kinase
MIDYGSHASIRITEQHCSFPIPKLAHSDELLSIKLIQHDVLADLTKLGLPVVEFDQHRPILDDGVICGYRMKKFFKLDLSELRSRTNDIRHTLNQLHSTGFYHGDFSPNNIMKDESGSIILIDFSFSGRLGSVVPSIFPSWLHKEGTYSIDSDLEAFHKYAVPI